MYLIKQTQSSKLNQLEVRFRAFKFSLSFFVKACDYILPTTMSGDISGPVNVQQSL